MEFHRPRKRFVTMPIVPMIDILFNLLIFFIVSTTFKKSRSVLPLDLPTVREVPVVTAREERSVLRVTPEGKVSIDTLRVPDGLLDAYLGAFLKENPGRKLELEADKNLPLGELLKVWDALTKAGIKIHDVPARVRVPSEQEGS